MTEPRSEQMDAINTVLLVDDDTFFHEACKRLMHRTVLVRTLITFSMAEDALDYLARTDRPNIDVLLLDINMPKMNGFEFLEKAITRFGKDFCSMIVVMLTSSLDPNDIKRAKECCAVNEFVNKPLLQEQIESIAVKLKADSQKFL